MNDLTDSQLAARVKAVLDADIQRLSPETLRRLQKARAQALSGSPAFKPFWFPAWGAAAVVILASTIIFWRMQDIPRDPQTQVQAEEEIEILMSADGLDLYEDLAFYSWLVEENQPG